MIDSSPSERCARVQQQIGAVVLRVLADDSVPADERLNVARSALAWAFAEATIGLKSDPDQMIAAYQHALTEIDRSTVRVVM